MNEILILAAVLLLALVVAIQLYFLVVRRSARGVMEDAERKAAELRELAQEKHAATVRDADLQAKEKLLQARNEFEKVSRERRAELETLERRLQQKEDGLDKRQEELARRETETAEHERGLSRQEKHLGQREEELDRLIDQERHKLEQIAGLTAQQAKEDLVRVMEKDAMNEAAHLVKRIEDEAKESANRNAQRILANAIQRNASDFVAETTVSVVLLPNDEMKGRIIGREGRNIRALEMATGVDLIVDDTPEAVILSGFDPFRREIARVALERLISDGRIHPARIEEVVERTKAEFDQRVLQEGEGALLELNIPDLHSDLVKLLGRLRFRTSYGQNVLKHSKEVAYLAA
ncbi:MAG: Rnase Y domain-containing protein, partial [Acidobacteriota bacterium]